MQLVPHAPQFGLAFNGSQSTSSPSQSAKFGSHAVTLHMPPAQWSPVVHGSRSSHPRVWGTFWQPSVWLQKSSVHGFVSGQPMG